jgi:multidrug efflux pump subunit AcrB
MRASDDGVLRVRLKDDSGVSVADLRDRLRKVLPEKVEPWLQGYLARHGLSKEEAEARSKQMSFGFEPGDIVSTVMSFGSPNPVEVLVIGKDREVIKTHTLKILAEMKKLEKTGELCDVQLYQQLEYPTVRVDIDRQMAGLSGVNVKDIAEATLVGNSSSRYVVRNYWRDPNTGVDYQVQIQVPTQRMDRPQEVENLPIRTVNSDSSLLLRDVATVRPSTTPGEIDRSAMHRYLSVTANVQGNDLGGAARDIQRAIADAGKVPDGVQVSVRGQLAPMTEMFRSLTIGLALSVVVILVLLTAYFQSFRVAVVSIGGVPGVVLGVATMLLLTGTSLNIESFMGSIMCIGVSVSNSVLLSTFMDDYWAAGVSITQSAIDGARDRLRPILMTASAMVLGTVPMALALEEGSGMTAPLGRAVIGGLLVSTFATLLIVPAMFVIVMGDAKKLSPSVYPDDPKSRHHDPLWHEREAIHGGPEPKDSSPG